VLAPEFQRRLLQTGYSSAAIDFGADDRQVLVVQTEKCLFREDQFL
jgi:hypothetical protein